MGPTLGDADDGTSPTTPIGQLPTTPLPGLPIYPPDAPAPSGWPSSEPQTPALLQERAAAPLPIALAVAGVVSVAAIGIAIAIVGTAANTTPVVPGVGATPAVTPTEPSAEPVAVAPVREADTNECVDAVGDGGSVDLDAVRLSLDDDDNLVAQFTLAAPLPAGESSLGVFATTTDGDRSYSLAASWVDGELDSFSVYDVERDRTTRLNARDIQWNESSVVAVFPSEVADRLDDDWLWYAYSTAQGADTDACPGAVDTFETLPFEYLSDENNSGGGNGGGDGGG